MSKDYQVDPKSILVVRSKFAKCQRCWNRNESIMQIPEYWDLCSFCAYSIDHHLVSNSEQFHKDNTEARDYRLKYLVQPGLVFQHYKGNYYQVSSQEVNKKTNEIIVHYKALYDGRNWDRPLSEFIEQVGGRPRFRYLFMVSTAVETNRISLSRNVNKKVAP